MKSCAKTTDPARAGPSISPMQDLGAGPL